MERNAIASRFGARVTCPASATPLISTLMTLSNNFVDLATVKPLFKNVKF